MRIGTRKLKTILLIFPLFSLSRLFFKLIKKLKIFSHTVYYIGFDVLKKYVLLPDFGWVKLKKRITFSGEIVSAEVSRVSDRYYLDLIFKANEKNANLV